MANTLQRYKPLPELAELNPGWKAGWKYGVLLLQAEPMEKVGSIIIAESTRLDEVGAAVMALIVDMSPTAFQHDDWANVSEGGVLPHKIGDIVLTKRYPAGVTVKGADGRDYLMTKDEEICGLRDEAAWAEAQKAA